MRIWGKKFLILNIVFAGVLVTTFNHCSSSSHEKSALDAQSLMLAGTFCEQGVKGLFANTFHPFLKQNATCINCHSDGPGKGMFANPDLNTAFSAFSQVGADQISTKAVSPDHNSPYTGTKHQSAINRINAQWNKGLVDLTNCGVINTPTPVDDSSRLHTTAKKIGLSTVAPSKVLEWNLSSELVPGATALPPLSGAKFQITVSKYTSTLGQTAYTISMPTLIAGSKDIRIKGIFVKINGKYVPDATTFSYVDESIYATKSKLLAGGTMLAVRTIADLDTISLAFGSVEQVTLPVLEPPPTVQFSQSSATVTESGKKTINVVLSQAYSQPVIVGVSLDSVEMAKIVPSSTIAKGLSYNPYGNFDWDYSFQNLSLVFIPGEVSKSFDITIADDQRFEQSEKFIVRLGTPENATNGLNRNLTVTITDDDVPPISGIPTFSQLMAPNGVLGYNCVKCHNSVNLQGGYDMSTFEVLVARGIVIPGDTKSLMYQRMNADDPLNNNLAPMPLDGFLEENNIQLVEKWILNGAKND